MYEQFQNIIILQNYLIFASIFILYHYEVDTLLFCQVKLIMNNIKLDI